jgi:DinB superfamily
MTLTPFSPYASILYRQFSAALDTLENAINACPDELWGVRMRGEGSEMPQFSQYWYVAYHALFWADVYLSGIDIDDGFRPPEPFTLAEAEDGVLPDRQYTKAELLSYITHCRQKAKVETAALTDEKASRLCKYSWGELMYAELFIDTIRHVQEHAAQLNLFLGQQQGLASRWVAKPKDVS